MAYSLAIDTGGTFTDLVLYDPADGRFSSLKGLTTYDDFVRGVAECLDRSGAALADAASIKFGSTLVINTYVQRNGARTALVATRGFRDVLETRRGNRSFPFDLRFRWREPLVPRDLRFEVTERMSPSGEVLQPLDLDDLERLARTLAAPELGIEAVAVGFLNAYANDAHEAQAAAFLRDRLSGVYVTCGSELSRQYYEFERTSTAVANAYVGPRVSDYLGRLQAWLSSERYDRPFFMMASNGGVYSAGRARREPVMLVESGPVGGCLGAAAYARALGLENVIAFDMGGTTAKCCVVKGGRFDIQSPYYVDGEDFGFPIQASVIDIVEVGAGGGSIAAVDAEGRLSVGPRSAGSNPGPACYGRGGGEPTVTDANVVLGRIGETLIGGEMRLDRRAAVAALGERVAAPMGLSGAADLDRVAQGVLDIGCLVMADAVKQITTVKGLDPRDFALFIYGGSGPLHAGQLAREIGVRHIVVPPHPGAFAALGMLMADARVDEQASFIGDLADEQMPRVREAFAELEARLAGAFREAFGDREVRCEWQADLQHQGQGHTVRVAFPKSATAAQIAGIFHDAYRRRYGHANPESPLEFVSLTAIGVARMDNPALPRLDAASPPPPTPGRRSVHFPAAGRIDAPVYVRGELPRGFEVIGPAIVEEYGTSTVIDAGDHLQVGEFGELNIRLGQAAAQTRVLENS